MIEKETAESTIDLKFT